jgi:hypothetical protein
MCFFHNVFINDLNSGYVCNNVFDYALKFIKTLCFFHNMSSLCAVPGA